MVNRKSRRIKCTFFALFILIGLDLIIAIYFTLVLNVRVLDSLLIQKKKKKKNEKRLIRLSARTLFHVPIIVDVLCCLRFFHTISICLLYYIRLNICLARRFLLQMNIANTHRHRQTLLFIHFSYKHTSTHNRLLSVAPTI